MRAFVVATVAMARWSRLRCSFSAGVHYVGAFWRSRSRSRPSSFRLTLGLVLTLIFVTRGFAAAVWTHAVYDAWVLVLLLGC